MSNEDFFATGPRAATVSAVAMARSSEPLRPEPRRRWPIAVVAAVVLVGLVAAALHLRPQARDTRPVVLPDTFAGSSSAPQAQQFERQGDWRTQMTTYFAGNAYDGHAYGTRSPVHLMNVVVARTEATSFGDVHLGVAPFTDHGDVRCTRTFQVPGQSGPSRESLSMLLCFRAEPQLTVSVLALGRDQDEAALAAAVDDVWALQG